jgi:hypothetical protein
MRDDIVAGQQVRHRDSTRAAGLGSSLHICASACCSPRDLISIMSASKNSALAGMWASLDPL